MIDDWKTNHQSSIINLKSSMSGIAVTGQTLRFAPSHPLPFPLGGVAIPFRRLPLISDRRIAGGKSTPGSMA
jgi:hypothetical protein